MRISLIKEKKIDNIILPDKVFGNFWITDKDVNGMDKNLISIEAIDNKWSLVSNNEAYYENNDNMMCPSVQLMPDNFYKIKKNNSDDEIIIYCENIRDSYQYLDITDFLINGIDIGNSNSFISHPRFTEQEVIIKKENDKVYLCIVNANQQVYVNNVRVSEKIVIKTGDMIFIQGLRMYLVYLNGKIFLAVNNPCNQTNYNQLAINIPNTVVNTNFDEPIEEQEILLYDENDYFHKMPRFFSKIEPIDMKIDAPPAKKEEESNSILLTVGPMLTMSMTSLVTGYTSVSSVLQGNTTWENAIPSLVVCGAMVASAIVWPLFTKSYQNVQNKKKEKLRQDKYKQYIDSKKEIIREGINKQSQILKNSYPTTKECEEIILNKYVSLWQRRIEDEDFLELNIGVGDYPMKININYPEDHFSMIEDNLKKMVTNLGSEPKTLTKVPVTYSFTEHFISAVVGKPEIASELIKRLLIQMVALHSYDDLKIVIVRPDKG